MHSIIEQNELPADKFRGWQNRLDEVCQADNAALKELCRQHFSRAFDERIASTKTALAAQLQLRKMSRDELERQSWLLYDTPEWVFNACNYMSRLEPGIAAIRKLAGGKLPPDLEDLHSRMWDILSQMEDVRRWFYESMITSSNRELAQADLPFILGPLVDAFQYLILSFYLSAKEKYGLLELNGKLQ